MTTDRELERLLDRWLDDGPRQSPDRVLLTTADRIARQRQRPAWRLQPWRFPTMTFPVRLAAALALLLVILLGGTAWYVGRQNAAPVVSPSPSATPAPTPLASARVLRGPTTLPAAGRYAFLVEEPPTAGGDARVLHVTTTLPAGWAAKTVGPTDFALSPPGASADDAVIVNIDMRRAAKDAACTEGPEPGVGFTAADLIGDLRADPQLDVSPPVDVTAGSLQGQSIDIALKPSATRTCPFSNGAPAVPLIVDAIDGTGPFWGIGPGERIRLAVFDRPDGHNLTVLVDAAAGSAFDALVAAAMPAIESIAVD